MRPFRHGMPVLYDSQVSAISSGYGRQCRGKLYHQHTCALTTSMWYTQMRANVQKVFVHIAQILDSGPPWGSHNPFRISAQSPSASINWMQKVERESLGCKKINSGHLSACRPQAKTDWVVEKQTKGKSWISLHSSYYVTNEPFILNQCVLQLHLITVSET